MPGVIMENGSRNGSHTNHDRDTRPNGMNGGTYNSEKMQDKGKARLEPQQNVMPKSPFAPNGLNGKFTGDVPRREGEGTTAAQKNQERSFQLPPEINHITQGYIGLKDLLSRMAQKTHSDLIGTITELSQMPVPSSALNGNLSHATALEDNSNENVNKKVRLLHFLETAHDSWTKALVIAGWSRRAEEVSKIIDLHVHLNLQKQVYLNILGQMGNDKKELMSARLLNPDLRTALEVLTTGKASWMPDLGYIQPPALTAKEILKSLEKLNTLLSMRLNLNDYDSIPIHFKDYTIKSGRATFKVVGEYEVDLTIAEEEPQSQFWFIDFRFDFNPSPKSLDFNVKTLIEGKVNEVLLKDGLSGCYKYLHELVLTHKINEFKRQANALSRGNWIETLGVEPLNRSLCIQYWRNKHGKASPSRSWFILGVGSPRRTTAGPKSKATSHLFLRWFRDTREIEDADIPLDTVNISAETLLKSVIAKHVNYILDTIHDKLRTKPLFAKRELGLSSFLSATEPAESFLEVQLMDEQMIRVQIEPITGRFVFSPASPLVTRFENKLNRECKNLPDKAHEWIENLRYAFVEEAITSRGMTVGWVRTNGPIHQLSTMREDLKKRYGTLLPTEYSTILWFRRPGWDKDWHLAALLSMSGEHWFLIQTANAPSSQENTNYRTMPNTRNQPADPKVTNLIPLPIGAASPNPSYGFMSTLNTFAAGVVSHYANLQALHSRRCAYMLRQGNPSRSITFPSIYIRADEILPKNRVKRFKEVAKNLIRLSFQGIETIPRPSKSISQASAEVSISSSHMQPSRIAVPGQMQNATVTHPTLPQREENSFMVVEARMILPTAKGVASIHGRVDQDIAFNHKTGTFAFRLRCGVGESVIDALSEVAVRVERLVDFVQVLEQTDSLKCEIVSLGRITFRYGQISHTNDGESMSVDHGTATYKATIDFSAAENTMGLILEEGNPHIRIVDSLTKVLNSPEGLEGVATLLPQTLPVNRALDSLEKNWPLSKGADDNEMFVIVRAADLYTVRYLIRQPRPQDSKTQASRHAYIFQIKLRQRRGDPWWYVVRIDNAQVKEPDALDAVLGPLWSSSGNGWQGMRTSGVAQKHGIQELLEKLDEVMRKFALTEEASSGPAVAQAPAAPIPTVQPQAAAPVSTRQNPGPLPRHQQQQQQRQLHTPNQSQSQSQGRSQGIRREQEPIEID